MDGRGEQPADEIPQRAPEDRDGQHRPEQFFVDGHARNRHGAMLFRPIATKTPDAIDSDPAALAGTADGGTGSGLGVASSRLRIDAMPGEDTTARPAD